jgi:hypothetical protein
MSCVIAEYEKDCDQEGETKDQLPDVMEEETTFALPSLPSSPAGPVTVTFSQFENVIAPAIKKPIVTNFMIFIIFF